jgi:hypothetical protein
MKIKRAFLVCLSLCFVSAQNAVARDNLAAPANLDPDRIRAIVEQMATKSDAKAVLFSMWPHDREVMTMTLGESMTTVPVKGVQALSVHLTTVFQSHTLKNFLYLRSHSCYNG